MDLTSIKSCLNTPNIFTQLLDNSKKTNSQTINTHRSIAREYMLKIMCKENENLFSKSIWYCIFCYSYIQTSVPTYELLIWKLFKARQAFL